MAPRQSKKQSQQKSRDAPARSARRTSAPAEERRHDEIAVAAYYRAQRRGFAPGHELEDWLEAESEVSRESARSRRMAR